MGNAESTMGNAANMDIDDTLALSLEKLKKLRGGRNNEQLPNIERYVRDEISTLLDAEATIREHYYKTVEVLVGSGMPYELSGSVVEGAMTARLFQVNKDYDMETDSMLNMFTIPQELSHLLEPVKDKPGFVRLPVCLLPAYCIYWYIGFAIKFLGRHGNEQHSLEQLQHYVSPLVIRDTWKCINDQLSLTPPF